MATTEAPARRPWDVIAKEKRERLEKCIPEEWRVTLNESTNPRRYLDAEVVGSILTPEELRLTRLDATELLDLIHNGKITSEAVTIAFCKRAAIAFQVTNPLCEIFFEEGIERARELDEILKTTGKIVGPLHGLPVSVKDHIALAGYDANMGFTAWCNDPAREDALAVKIFREAGAVFYVKTTMPQAGMANETVSPIHGRTVNSYSTLLSPGGSSGGEGSLIGMFGSPLGMGTDIAGSIRAPASYNGLYGLRTTERRLPMLGCRGTDPGMISIYSVLGPLARSLRDCELFLRVILQAEPWLDDPTTLRMPWRWNETVLPEKLVFGVIRWDEHVQVHPPVARAIDITVESLRKAGHEVIEWRAPENGELSFDTITPLFYGNASSEVFRIIEEADEPWMPAIKLSIRDNPVIHEYRKLTVQNHWEHNVARDKYRLAYTKRWQNSGSLTSSGRKIDAILAPTGCSASLPHDHKRWFGYTAVWNLLDYPTAVVPVLNCDSKIDKWEGEFKSVSERDEINYHMYDDPTIFDGVPVGVSVVGRTSEDEKVLKMAMVIDDVIKKAGHGSKS